MGWIKDAKAKVLADESRKAMEDGRQWFTPVFNAPSTRSGFSRDIPDWSMMIEAITDNGWVLHNWSVTESSGNMVASAVFYNKGLYTLK